MASRDHGRAGHDTLWIVGTLAGLAVLFPGFVGLLWRIGLFDLPATDAGAQAFAAVIALLGGLVVALLTFAGVLLKLSFEREADERRKIDSSIRGLGLLITPSGQAPGQVQQAGALFALANLGQLRFALSLLQRMWPTGQVDSSHALWVIDRGFEDSDENIQYQAASLLRDNAGRLNRMDSAGGYDFDWPDKLRWQASPDLKEYSTTAIFRALHDCLLSKHPKEWTPDALLRFVNFFERMYRGKDTVDKGRTGLTLGTLLDLPRFKGIGDVPRLEGEADLELSDLRETLRRSMDDAKSTPSRYSRELEVWARGEDPPPLLPP